MMTDGSDPAEVQDRLPRELRRAHPPKPAGWKHAGQTVDPQQRVQRQARKRQQQRRSRRANLRHGNGR